MVVGSQEGEEEGGLDKEKNIYIYKEIRIRSKQLRR